MLEPILTTESMARAEQAAVQGGLSLQQMMLAAGKGLAAVVQEHFPEGPVLILAGAGNNGGDGYVAATELQNSGRLVGVCPVLPPQTALCQDMARGWSGRIIPLEEVLDAASGAAVIIDAVFGTGLSRPLIGAIVKLFEQLAALEIPVVAADLPSGVDASTGELLGGALPAAHTVSFGAIKAGALLLPGKAYTGTLHTVDIGLAPESTFPLAMAWRNTPELWQGVLPTAGVWQHKYDRGHSLIVHGEMIGATKLMAEGAARSGCGLCTVAAWQKQDQLMLHLGLPAAVMVRSVVKQGDVAALLRERKITATAYGAGAGTGAEAHLLFQEIVGSGVPLVLDADGLDLLAAHPECLLQENTVLTPHSGEFARVFPDLTGTKVTKAQAAAAKTGAVMVFKGSDTVIAAPDGRVAISDHAPPTLATAGSGDVLTGIICGLLAQGMPVWEAACAGVWLHSQCAQQLGFGLIADDLPSQLPAAMLVARSV